MYMVIVTIPMPTPIPMKILPVSIRAKFGAKAQQIFPAAMKAQEIAMLGLRPMLSVREPVSGAAKAYAQSREDVRIPSISGESPNSLRSGPSALTIIPKSYPSAIEATMVNNRALTEREHEDALPRSGVASVVADGIDSHVTWIL
jgi:hypothetical protein